MTKLYKAISGKRTKLIGVGANLIEAVIDAFDSGYLDYYNFLDNDETLNDIADYILTAHQDYVIIVDKGDL